MSNEMINDKNALSFLNNLNEEQKNAVIYCDSPQLILSGAGSGKTRVLTYKIVYLIKNKNISPENILALTFTRKGANEMKERISQLLGEKYSKKIIMGTFHSVFLKILRKTIIFAQNLKYNEKFKIINENEVKKNNKKNFN